MRSEEEIRRMLRKFEELLRCPKCKEIEPDYDWDGGLKCNVCDKMLDPTWEHLGVWKALKWVLGGKDELLLDLFDLE